MKPKHPLTEIFTLLTNQIRNRRNDNSPLTADELSHYDQCAYDLQCLEAQSRLGIAAIGSTLAAAANGDGPPRSEVIAELGWLLEFLGGMQDEVSCAIDDLRKLHNSDTTGNLQK